jgi:hypothetical protein
VLKAWSPASENVAGNGWAGDGYRGAKENQRDDDGASANDEGHGRMEYHDRVVVAPAGRDGVGAGKAVEQIVEAPVFLNDEHDVLDDAARRRCSGKAGRSDHEPREGEDGNAASHREGPFLSRVARTQPSA